MTYPSEIPSYLFLDEDLHALRERIAKIERDIKELHDTIAESTRQSSETWHDNFMFEEGSRQLDVLHKELEQLSHVAAHASVIESSDVHIGKNIHYRDINTGNEHRITLGSYLLLSPRPGTASYSSPLGRLFLRAQTGATVSGMIGEDHRSFLILSIS